ncbi:MAG: DUF4442 domain-containing protein [Wenzhouxiangellaceae bacterium]
MKASRLRLLMNWWPPFWAAGIKVDQFSADYRQASVSLHARWYNKNYVGTHFGGSLFAMTDPFYMIMYLQNLGRDYLVWDHSASIRFVRPGRGRVQANFVLEDQDLQQAIAATASGEKFLREHRIEIIDEQQETVAEVVKTIYFRRKPPRNSS